MGEEMTDTTKHPEQTIVCILLLASTVDWAADCLANIIGALL